MPKNTLLENTAKILLADAMKRLKENRHYNDDPSFNLITAIGKDRDETHVHSRIIFYLLTHDEANIFSTASEPHEKIQRQKINPNNPYLKLFLETLKIPSNYLDNDWSVFREKSYTGNGIDRIDFVMESSNYLIAIEMKIDAGDGNRQLSRYRSICKKSGKAYRLYYLTLDRHEASSQSKGIGNRIVNISFEEEMIQWLEKCLEISPPDSYQHSFIIQYLGTVKTILGLDEGADMENLITSKETAKAAKAIANHLKDIMEQLKEDFIVEIDKNLRKMIIAEHINIPDADITLDDDHLNTEIIIERAKYKGNICYFSLCVEFYERYPCFFLGFSTDDGLLTLSDAQNGFPAFYKKWMTAIDHLNLPNALHRNKESKWIYLQNSKGEEMDFSQYRYNDAALDLIDNLESECKYIAKDIVNTYLKPLYISRR